MELRSRKVNEFFDIMYEELYIENQVDLSNVILARWESDFLNEVLKVTPDPDNPGKTISQDKLAKMAGLTQKTISNLAAGRGRVSWESVQRVGEALGLHFVADYNHTINNEKVLEAIKARYN